MHQIRKNITFALNISPAELAEQVFLHDYEPTPYLKGEIIISNGVAAIGHNESNNIALWGPNPRAFQKFPDIGNPTLRDNHLTYQRWMSGARSSGGNGSCEFLIGNSYTTKIDWDSTLNLEVSPWGEDTR